MVSADGHAGGDIRDYRPYLSSRWHDEFDAWAAEYVNPYADLIAPIAYRSWDSDRRLAETESDGIAAEVLFPNTVPPFFAEGNLVALPPTPEDYERRWAGVQAHNRWLADFCAATPGRRAGIVQVFANDMDDAVAEVRWAAATFDRPFGGILLPSIPPNSHLPPLWEDHYEPLWRVCAELDVPINIHGGSALARLRGARGGAGHDAHRDPVVQPPLGVAPHLLRRARALPDTPLRRDRAGRGLAAAGAADARLVLRPHDDGTTRPRRTSSVRRRPR